MWQELRVCGQRHRRRRKQFGPAIAHGEDIALSDSPPAAGVRSIVMGRGQTAPD